MFYSAELLSIKSHSGLSVIWLAATLGPRSQAKRISRRDFVGVDIAGSCRYVITPPQPLSLRLASSLMVGISRVYGQQCQIQFLEAQTFWSRLALGRGGEGMEKSVGKTKTISETTKAAKDTITHELAPADANISLDMPLSEILKELLTSPEAGRGRSSKVSSSRVPSLIEAALGGTGGILPFEPLPMELGSGLLGIDELAPWETFTTTTAESLKHGLGSRTSTTLVPGGEMEVPEMTELAPNQGETKRRRLALNKPRSLRLDTTIQLDKPEQFLEKEEGLIAEPRYALDILLKLFPEASLVKNKKKLETNQKSSLPARETGRGLEPDRLPYEHDDYISEMATPILAAGYQDESISISSGGGVGSFRGLSINSIGLAASSPISGKEWQLASHASVRRDSMTLLQRLHVTNSEGDDFFELLGGKPRTRRELARNFYQVLDLVTIGAIRVNQSRPYGAITVHRLVS